MIATAVEPLAARLRERTKYSLDYLSLSQKSQIFASSLVRGSHFCAAALAAGSLTFASIAKYFL